MLVADLRHFLDLPDDTPGPARRLAEQLGDLVKAATAEDPGVAWVSALTCRRRPGHRRCVGRMIVRRADVDGPIAWQCSTCGDAGQISGWEGTPYDLSDPGRRSSGGVRQVRVPDRVAAALRELRLLDADAERVVYRAGSNGDGDVMLTATDDELDELIGNLAAEANHESNRRRQQRLDAAIEVLDQAAPKPDGPGTVSGPYRPKSNVVTDIGVLERDTREFGVLHVQLAGVFGQPPQSQPISVQPKPCSAASVRVHCSSARRRGCGRSIRGNGQRGEGFGSRPTDISREPQGFSGRTQSGYCLVGPSAGFESQRPGTDRRKRDRSIGLGSHHRIASRPSRFPG